MDFPTLYRLHDRYRRLRALERTVADGPAASRRRREAVARAIVKLERRLVVVRFMMWRPR